jgi:tetratricopeptide (TPR) repeat protein
MARCYDHALNVNPKYVETWSRKGGALHIIGRCGSVLACLKEALRCFDQVLRLDPHHIAASGRKKQALKAISRLK